MTTQDVDGRKLTLRWLKNGVRYLVDFCVVKSLVDLCVVKGWKSESIHCIG